MAYRLLWVDDEIDLLKAHILYLEKKNYEVRTATNGYDALEICQTEIFDRRLTEGQRSDKMHKKWRKICRFL